MISDRGTVEGHATERRLVLVPTVERAHRLGIVQMLSQLVEVAAHKQLAMTMMRVGCPGRVVANKSCQIESQRLERVPG